MRIEAVPGREFKARIDSISLLARVDFSAGWPPPRNFSLGLYGQNLFDTAYKTEGQEFSSVGNIRTVYYGAPMTWYLRGTFRF